MKYSHNNWYKKEGQAIKGGSRAVGLLRRCPVCDKRLIGNPHYCGECGSKI